VDGVLRWSQGDRWFGRVTVVEQHGRSSVPSSRLANLRAALGFLQLPPRAPELQLLHRWHDTWIGLGQVVGGVERRGCAATCVPARIDADGAATLPWRPMLLV